MTILASINIGRAPENDVVLPGRSVSRRHAALDIAKDGRLRLRDLGSKSGTWLLRAGGWQRVTEEFVGPADQLRFATEEMTVEGCLVRAGKHKLALAQRALASASVTLTVQRSPHPD